MRLLVAALAAIVAMALPGDTLAAFPGDNGRLSITNDTECVSDPRYVDTFEPHFYDVEPTGGNYGFHAVHSRSAAWSPDGQRLVYEFTGAGGGTLYTANADGTGHQLVLNNGGYQPAWSPDGRQIAYQTLQNDIHVINADGTGDVTLTSGPASDRAAAWSPDGNRIAFASDRDGDYEIYTMDPNGSDVTQLTADPVPDGAPNWSPDGTKIAFHRGLQIMVMNANGSGQMVIPSSSKGGGDPAWSPDGSMIAFQGADGIYTMNADGSDLTLVQSHLDCSYEPDWQPLLRGYVRPRGATPTRVPLVPAAKQCTSPNSTHGAPLSFPSCSPPQTETSATFLGIGDGNPSPARSIGHVLLRVLDGSATPGDDSDLQIRLQITHVMRPDRSDYPGELRLELPLRITDRFNRPHPNVTGPGTVADTSFYATVPCTTTPSDALTGSTCALTSTADAILPATVREGARSVWGLGQIKLHDGGADEDADTAADNQLLAVQGVFVP
jgi:WD40-like Beta Propeller Repeat